MKSDEELAREAAAQAVDETRAALEAKGINAASLAKQHRAELRAKETKFIKVKGSVFSADELAAMAMGERPAKVRRPYRVIACGSEESVIAVDMVNWGVRQTARMDANRLRGDYPAERKHITGSVSHVITFDSISAAERELLLEASRTVQSKLTGGADGQSN